MDPYSSQDQPQNQDQPQSTPKQQVAERIKSATNVLVTVKSNPSVDELAATIGLTIMLNKLGKHATAVFSGNVPSTLEFLKPEETIETNTDSLRDFIVSLDKSKADKLRYKVEENVVKIFITPYRTSITQDDLEFTQGDFNVDAVIALGVTQRDELDQAITSHGRILHDATVVTVTVGQDYSELGQINWQEQAASSLSEMLVSISEALQGGLIDEQIATAFLTGIVSETERFSNPKTSPKVMTMAAQLMAAGANQQLIANELEKEIEVPAPEEALSLGEQNDDTVAIDEAGTLSISHEEEPALESDSVKQSEQPQEAAELPAVQPVAEPENLPEPPAEPASSEPLPAPSEIKTTQFLPPLPTVVPTDSYHPSLEGQPTEGLAQPALPPVPAIDEQRPDPTPADAAPFIPPTPQFDSPEAPADDNQIHIDIEGNLLRKAAAEPKHKVIQPLSSPQEIVASTVSEPAPLVAPSPFSAPDMPLPPSAPDVSQILSGQSQPEDSGILESKFPPPPPPMDMTPSAPLHDETTLTQIEQAVQSPHLEQPSTNSARDAVAAALNQTPFDPAHNTRSDVGSLPLGAPPEQSSYDSFRLPDTPPAPSGPVTDVSNNLPGDFSTPQAEPVPAFSLPGQDQSQNDNGIAPPSVPPPMMPQ